MKEYLTKRSWFNAKTRGYFASFWLFAITLVVGCFFQENIAFFDEDYTTWMSDTEYFISFAIALVLIVGYILYCHKCFHYRISFVFLIAAIILAIGNAVAVFTFPAFLTGIGETMDGAKTIYFYELTDMNRWRYVLSFFVGAIYLYVLFSVAPKAMRGSKQLSLIFWIVIGIAAASIIFSLIREWNLYVLYFDEKNEQDVSALLVSFTNNRNTYGSILMLGVFAALFLNSQSHHFYHWLFVIVFYAMALLTICKTVIIITGILILAYIVYRFVITVKYHPIGNVILISLLLLVAGVITIFVSSGQAFEIPGFGKALQRFFSIMQRSEYGSMNARAMIWRHIFQLLDTPTKLIFGVGETNFFWLLGSYEGGFRQLGWPHNGVGLQFGAGGLLRLAFYILLLGYLVFVIVKCIAMKSRIAVTCFMLFIATIAYGFTESTAFLDIASKGMAMTLIVVFPCLVEYHRGVTVAEPTRVRLFAKAKEKVADIVYHPIDIAKVFIFSLTSVSALYIAIAPIFSFTFSITPLFIATYLGVLIFSTYAVYHLAFLEGKKKAWLYLFMAAIIALYVATLLFNLVVTVVILYALSFFAWIFAAIMTSKQRMEMGRSVLLRVIIPEAIYFCALALPTYIAMRTMPIASVTRYVKVAFVFLAVSDFLFFAVLSPTSGLLLGAAGEIPCILEAKIDVLGIKIEDWTNHREILYRKSKADRDLYQKAKVKPIIY